MFETVSHLTNSIHTATLPSISFHGYSSLLFSIIPILSWAFSPPPSSPPASSLSSPSAFFFHPSPSLAHCLSLSSSFYSLSPIPPHSTLPPLSLSLPSSLSACSSRLLLTVIHQLVSIPDGAIRCSMAAMSPFFVCITVPHARCIGAMAFFSLTCSTGRLSF